MIKVIAAQDSTTMSVTRTDVDTGVVTADPSFVLNFGEYREFLSNDYTLIEAMDYHSIGVFQYSRSFQADNIKHSDPFMMYVPPTEQYSQSYAVATAPFDPSLVDTLPNRGPYVNHTNIVVPAEHFDTNLLTVNNKMADPSDFIPIRSANNQLWGDGGQVLDVGAQVISHKFENATLGVTMYGFSIQISWGYPGGVGLAPIGDACEVGRITVSVLACRRARTTIAFHVTGKPANAITKCKLDGGRFIECTSPQTYRNLDKGKHKFTVSAVCPGGLSSQLFRRKIRVC